MAGHSKWANIKHKKAATDAKKGQAFTKLARDITMAARQGDPNPDMNASLRLAVQKAKAANMPNDNIDRAIQRGVGGAVGSEAILAFPGVGHAVAVVVRQVSDDGDGAGGE